MIKSVFIKYILVFLVILIASFTILAAVISSGITRNSIEAKKISMEIAANIAKQHVEMSFNNSKFISFYDYALSEKDNLSNRLLGYSNLTEDSLIIIADLNGNIIITTPMSSVYLTKDSINTEIIQNILNSNSTPNSVDNSFQTLNGVFNKRHIMFTQVLKSNKGEAYGVLFFCSPSVYDKYFVERLIKNIILSCLWILVASLVILYFITEKIVSPVREMSKAAKSFAGGRFDVRVPVKGISDEIGELASAFNNMAAALADNEETQRSFLASVSHDLRTPMNSIGGFVDGILDGTIPPEEHVKYLNTVSAETKRLARLVSSLFEITKMQSGEIKFIRKNFDICEMARNALIFLEKKIEAKNLEIEFNCDEDNMYIFADSDATRRILDNLLENAIKFTPEKGLLRINITNGGKERDKKILISVYNTGAGIPAEDLPSVFDRFFKSDRSRGLDKSGAGLGLFIVKTIIEAHDEKIWVTSEYEKDCDFTFTMQKSPESAVKHRSA